MPCKKNSPGNPCCTSGECDWSCTIPNPVCITASACGQTLILEDPPLEAYVSMAMNYCRYAGYQNLTFEPETSTAEQCSFDTRMGLSPDSCIMYPDGNYGQRFAQVGEVNWEFICYRSGIMNLIVTFDPSAPGRLTLYVTVSLTAMVYIHVWGSIDYYVDNTCPAEIPTWVFDHTDTFDSNFFVDEFGDFAIYSYTEDVDCESILGEYIVPRVDGGSGETISGTYSGFLGFGPCDTVSPTYDFGNIGCGLGVAYVTLASSPCV